MLETMKKMENCEITYLNNSDREYNTEDEIGHHDEDTG